MAAKGAHMFAEGFASHRSSAKEGSMDLSCHTTCSQSGATRVLRQGAVWKDTVTFWSGRLKLSQNYDRGGGWAISLITCQHNKSAGPVYRGAQR